MNKIIKIYLAIIFLLLTVLIGCKKEKIPIISTTSISNITPTTATSGGSITDEGSSTVLTRGVCWSTGNTPTVADNKTTDGAGAGSFSSNITGLTGGAIYYVRAYATNTVGTGYGMAMSFTTLGQSPVPTNGAATNINTTTATLNGTVNANYLSTIVTFEYGTTTSYGSTATSSQSPVTGNSNTNVSADITGLTAGTLYHYRLKAVNSLGTTYSNDITFTTLGQAPDATTQAATNIAGTSTTLNGSVNAHYLSTVVSFEYGTSTSYGSTIAAFQSPVTGNSTTSVSVNVTGLSPNTTYHFRVKTVNLLGTNYGNDLTFTTLGQAPVATTQEASAITTVSASINGTVNPNFLSTTITFEYGTTTSYGTTATATQSPATGNSIISVSTSVSSLSPNTIYHYRIKAVNVLGTSYGNDMTFTTLGNTPSATILAATSITTSGALLNGTVNANYLSTTVTFEYGTTTSYGSTATATQSPVTGSANNNVSVTITGLGAGTIYHFRIVATNSLGTTNSGDMTFTTLGQVPTATTMAATSTTPSGAQLNGSVNANYLSTEVTFEYGTTTSYGTSAVATQSPVTGSTNTNVSVIITGLTMGTSYHYRIKTVNSLGTTYGSDMTFTAAYVIGENIYGGIIFYIDGTGQHGLVCAPSDQGIRIAWGCYGATIAGADGTAIGTGNQNTIDIMSGCATLGIAAQLCGDLVLGGYDDWYLPSKDELNLLWLNRTIIGGFSVANYSSYWSSSEYSNTYAWLQSFITGTQFYDNKGYSQDHYVRAIRSF